jgi:hypothetical protein
LAASTPFTADNLIALASEEIDLSQPIQQQLATALSDILHPAAVRFKFSIQQLTTAAEVETLGQIQQQPLTQRLWVLCKSHKSLDYAILAAPLAQKLRSLGLTNFQDAIFRCEAPGLQQPDWRLRIDLTPPAMMLRGWAKWGDIQAITLLANLIVQDAGLQVSGVLKNWRLHLFCCIREHPPGVPKFPNKQQAINLLVPLFHRLAPQGIQGATIYGVQALPSGLPSEQESPLWVHWIELPAATDPAYTLPPLLMAEQGNEQALTFILQRLLNPDIEQCFTNGGLGLSLMYREGILHIMSEATVCPLQSQIVDPVMRVLRQLAIPGVMGVRIYGRIAGQQLPNWTHGDDFHRVPAQLVGTVEGMNSTSKIQPPPSWHQRLTQSRWFTPATPLAVSLPYQQTLSWRALMPWLAAGCLGIGIVDWSAQHLANPTATTGSTNLAPPDFAPQPAALNNRLLEEKIANYQKICQTQGIPEVLIVGSSRAMRGVDPHVLRQELATKGYGKAHIYNLGINGATAQVVNLILRQLLPPSQLPKMVIWADGARAFNDGRTDQTYTAIANSPGYRKLPDNNPDRAAITQAQPLVRNGYEQVDRTLNQLLANFSQAYRHRQQIKTKLQASTPRWPSTQPSDRHSPHLPSHNIGGELIDAAGFLALTIQFNPNSYYQDHVKVTGDNDGDYTNFTLTGSQHQALQQTIDLLKTRGIPLIFVNVPLSDRYLDPVRQKHEFAFKQYMQALNQDRQLQFIDLVGSWMQEYSFYSDPSHLNRFGASQVSTYLVRNAPIDWHLLAPSP